MSSAPSWRKSNIEDQFSDYGVEKFIKFSQKANLGYLLISGGGEPLNKRKHILKIIENVTADRIVLVTSGNWAKNYVTGLKYLEDIHQAIKKRTGPTHVVVRVSVSEFHSVKLGIGCALNIINAFESKFSDSVDLTLQIKSFNGDFSLTKLISKLDLCPSSGEEMTLQSDNDILKKIIPKKITLKFKSGYKIVLGISNIFYSSIKPNLNKVEEVQSAIDVFEDDLEHSEDNNPGVVSNYSGHMGIDWSISYNGNVGIWQSQSRDTCLNLYEDSYKEINRTYMDDPLTYSFLDKGVLYREKIISEVNPKAVLRYKAIGLRDAAGAILFEEEKTRLYYSIRVLQDYINEDKILESDLSSWPREIIELVGLSKIELMMLYKKSPYNIIEQQKNKNFSEVAWYDLFELIKLGHYDISEQEIKDALGYFNSSAANELNDLSSLKEQKGAVIRRLTERLTHIKKIEPYNFKNVENG